MSTIFNMTRDINGYNGFGLKPADPVDQFGVILASGVAQTLATVPGNYSEWIAIFSYESGSNPWVAINDTAELPTGTAGSINSELRPTAVQLQAGDTISVITNDTTAEVGVKLYALG